MIEAILVAGLVAAAVFTVSTFEVPVTDTESFNANNEQLVEDSLKALYHRPSTYNSGQTFGSMLEQYVLEALAGDNRNLQSYLNKSLPSGARYNVYLDTGHGTPRELVYTGAPAKEAVASTYPIVPRLAYTFLKPGFSHYHGDFAMSTSAVPVYHGLLARDEGESVELTVTYKEDDGSGPYTLKVYGQTALRKNVDDGRKWPSASIFIEDGGMIEQGGEVTYYVDARDTTLNALFAGAGQDAYSIDFSIRIMETAGVELSRGTKISLEFPRMWAWKDHSKEELEAANEKFWEDLTYTGSDMAGTTITARLKDPVDPLWFNVTGDYRGLLDTAYPYFSPIHVSLGSGVQGASQFMVKNPTDLNLTSIMSRDAWISTTKPLIAEDTTTWGAMFTNTGGDIDVTQVTLRQPDGKDLLSDVSHISGTGAGAWSLSADGETYAWEPDASHVDVGRGEAFWLALQVTAAQSNANDYRNRDYLTVQYHYSPENTTGTNTIDDYDYSKRAWRQSPEWAYDDKVQPYDDGDALGWPDESGNRYWMTASSYYDNHELMGNATYSVLPMAITSNTFGEYRGAAARSTLSLMDDRMETRQFTLGQDVYVKNDFSALFESLTTINALSDVDVESDVRVHTEVYAPERAWRGEPSETFTETLKGYAPSFADITDMLAGDTTGDDVKDLLVLDQSGAVTALDGRDGSRLWGYDPGADIEIMRLGDVDDDGHLELVLALDNGKIVSVDTAASGVPDEKRERWTYTFQQSGTGATVKDMVLVGDGTAGRPDIIVSGTWASHSSQILALDVTATDSVDEHSTYTSDHTSDHTKTGMPDLQPVHWDDALQPTHVGVSSTNGTVLLLATADVERVAWVSVLHHTPRQMAAGDMDDDGDEELVVNTEGREVYLLNGTEGRFGPTVRGGLETQIDGYTPSSEFYKPVDSVVLPDGGVVAVDLSPLIMQDRTGLFEPTRVLPATDLGLNDMNVDELLEEAPGELKKEWAATQLINGTAYIVGRDGEVRGNTTPAGNQWNWESVHPAVVGYESALLYDAYLEPDFADNGTGYAIDDHGVINKTTGRSDEWSPIAAICDGSGTGNNATSCNPLYTYVYKWHVETHANGSASKFYILTTRDNALWSFDVDTEEWTEHHAFDSGVSVIDRDTEGTWYVAGDNMYIAEAPSPDGPWTQHTVHGHDTSDPDENPYVADLEMVDSDTGYVLGDLKVFTYRGEKEWQPLHLDASGTPELSLFMLDDDDHPWVFGETYALTPLATYGGDGQAVYEVEMGTFDGDVREIHLETDEYDYGDYGDVSWEWREGPGDDWQPLTIPDGHLEPQDTGRSTVERTGTIRCDDAEACTTIQLRATLQNRVWYDTPVLKTNPSVSPVVDRAVVSLTDDDGNAVADSTLDLAAMASGDAVYSDFHDGIRLTAVPIGWGHRDDDGSGTARQVHTLPFDADGTGGDEVMFTSAAGTQVFGGETGRHHLDGPWSEAPQQMLVAEMTGDDLADVTAVLSGAETHIWNVDANTVTKDTNASGTVTALVDKSPRGDIRSVAFGGSAALVYVIEDNTTDADGPELAWSTAPSIALGKITFKYEVPENALFGTYFVVSEMSWEYTEGDSGTVTQTARMVEWLDVVPPSGKMPKPPIYEIEIVAWYDEL